MVHIDHVFGDLRYFIDKLEVETTTENRVAGHEINTALAQSLSEQDIFTRIVDRHDDIGLGGFDPQRNVIEVPCRVGVLD